MKIGILIHSQTGHTLKVANLVKHALEQKGHSVVLETITAHNQTLQKTVQLKNMPDSSGYDVIVLGCPVNGFRMSPVMSAYIAQMTHQTKLTGLFVTHASPFPGMGGKQTIQQMKSAVSQKGLNVKQTGIISWSRGREKAIQQLIQNMLALVEGLA